MYRHFVAIGFAVVCTSACGVGLEQSPTTETNVECTSSDACEEGEVCVEFECRAEAVDDDDRDGISNDEDNCSDIFNPDQADQDDDNIGDACDTDRDNDTIDDAVDNCIDVPNTDQTDVDQDDIGDACDDELPGPCNCTDFQTCDESTGTCLEPDTCVTNADCTEERICVGGACVIAPGCVTNADCGENEYCDATLQECAPEGCTTDSQCPTSQVCTDDGYCGTCSSSTPCPGNQECMGGSCFDAPDCTSDADCTMGRVCNAGNCETGSCGEDAYEPNNGVDFVTSTIEANGPIGSGTYDFALCTNDPAMFTGDEDWFEIDAAVGDGIIINALIEPSRGTTEMYLINANGEQINGSTQQGNYLNINVAALEQAPVYVQFLQFESIDAPITMDLIVVEDGYCLDDSWEPNNIGEGAHAIGSNPVTTFKDFSLCPDDEDWFSLSVSAGKTLEIDMTTQNGTPASLEVFAGGYADTDRVARDNTANSPKHIEFHPDVDTDYWVRILKDDGSEGGGEARFHVTD